MTRFPRTKLEEVHSHLLRFPGGFGGQEQSGLLGPEGPPIVQERHRYEEVSKEAALDPNHWEDTPNRTRFIHRDPIVRDMSQTFSHHSSPAAEMTETRAFKPFQGRRSSPA